MVTRHDVNDVAYDYVKEKQCGDKVATVNRAKYVTIIINVARLSFMTYSYPSGLGILLPEIFFAVFSAL